jgi:nucleoside-diphosphate kinase
MPRVAFLIKPHALEHASTIVGRLLDLPLVRLLSVQRAFWTQSVARAFYSEHEGKAFMPRVVCSMCGLVTQITLDIGDIDAFRSEVCGPTDPAEARATADATNTLRALYGVELPFNAVHCSDSPASAARELALLATVSCVDRG